MEINNSFSVTTEEDSNSDEDEDEKQERHVHLLLLDADRLGLTNQETREYCMERWWIETGERCVATWINDLIWDRYPLEKDI